MNSKTACEFVNKLLKKTISNEIHWNNVDNFPFSSPFAEKAYSYFANTKQGRIILGKPTYNSSEYRLFIVPSSGATYDLADFISWHDSELSKQYKNCLKELYEHVYNSHPNADSFINSFLED